MKADNLRISKVFSSGGDIHYVLPHFQREYTWDKDNWKTLWDDAIGVYDEIEPTTTEGLPTAATPMSSTFSDPLWSFTTGCEAEP
jgi:hypothetical protein